MRTRRTRIVVCEECGRRGSPMTIRWSSAKGWRCISHDQPVAVIVVNGQEIDLSGTEQPC